MTLFNFTYRNFTKNNNFAKRSYFFKWFKIIYVFPCFIFWIIPFFLFYFIISSDSLLILLFLISFQKIPSMHFRSCWFSFGFKTFEVSTCFLSWSSIVFIYFSKAFPREKWANLACSIILIWSFYSNIYHFYLLTILLFLQFPC